MGIIVLFYIFPHAESQKALDEIFLDGTRRNLTYTNDLKSWKPLAKKPSEVTFLLVRGDSVLKVSRLNFPNQLYQIGYSECAVLQLLEERNVTSKFPKCFNSGVLWIEGKQVHVSHLELIRGEHFSDAIRSASMHEIFEIIDSLLTALSELSDAGVSHRDIDACNVLVVKKARTAIIDSALSTSRINPVQGDVTKVRKLGRHRPPNIDICGYDDFYSASIMIKKSFESNHRQMSRGIRNIIYHLSRESCNDRITDINFLRSQLYQAGYDMTV